MRTGRPRPFPIRLALLHAALVLAGGCDNSPEGQPAPRPAAQDQPPLFSEITESAGIVNRPGPYPDGSYHLADGGYTAV